MASQVVNGKAFEYALLNAFYERLNGVTRVKVNENSSFEIAKKYFDSFSEKEKSSFSITASAAINFLIDIEPRLSHSQNLNDILELEIVSDTKGQGGDVRDVLTIRATQKWEIGISAKNNHRAVKHSRLSLKLDFGSKWLGFKCSDQYFDRIRPIFEMLRDIKKKDPSTKWNSIPNMHDTIYVPILNAFREELLRLDREHPNLTAENLVKYLIGKEDYYKVIKSSNKVEIQAFNIHDTLNQSYKKVKPKAKIQKLQLPTRLVDIVFKKGSKTTILVTLDEGWQISFRIHNASSRVEPSLKFDINLISSPHSLFSNHIFL